MTTLLVNVCRPDTFPVRRILRCPTCKQRRRFSGLDAAWYGVTWTCCACGDSFADGERLLRPSRARWRIESAAKAKAVWVEAGRFTDAQRRQWIHEQIHGPEVG
jgi:hypothetical protein